LDFEQRTHRQSRQIGGSGSTRLAVEVLDPGNAGVAVWVTYDVIESSGQVESLFKNYEEGQAPRGADDPQKLSNLFTALSPRE
jgi:hypothetical protein